MASKASVSDDISNKNEAHNKFHRRAIDRFRILCEQVITKYNKYYLTIKYPRKHNNIDAYKYDTLTFRNTVGNYF